MQIQHSAYTLLFEHGGVAVQKDGQTLYQNIRPMYAFIKTALAVNDFYSAGYDEVAADNDAVVATGILDTPTGTKLAFNDRYESVGESLKISRTVKVLEAVDDLGFATKLSFVLEPGGDIRAFDYFAPAAWYRHNQYTAPHVMGYDLDCEYFWRHETNYALPLFAAQNRQGGETITFSRWASDVGMRNNDIMPSAHHVDRKFNIGSIGVSRPSDKTLTYLYYGFPLRTQAGTKPEGLSIDYVYPGCDGELPRNEEVYNIDYMQRTKTMHRVYHPLEPGFTQSYSISVDFGRYDDFYSMMRGTWRTTYARLRDPLFEVDQRRHYHNCMKLLSTMTRQYGDSWGLPFSAQLPDLDISSVSFQFGFVGQQPAIGYQLLRYGTEEDDPEARQKGLNILDFWVRTAMTETGAPNLCYSPVLKGFEPYPYWIRMIADGLEAILEAFVYLSKKGENKPEYLAFCRNVAGWLLRVQNPDGSFYRAYEADGTMRMDSKANTTSIIRFLVQLYLVTKDESYRDAALRAGEWCYENVYKNYEYRGSTCDNLDILDNESGIYAMFAFLALYDLDGDARWLEALQAAADFTETWTYAWSYPVRTLWPKHPFNQYTISGQSGITIGGGGGDVYMAACSYTYYRLYVITGDEHYLNFAEFIHNNTRQSNDVDGSTGYVLPGLGHECCEFGTQTLKAHYHWLPWCTFVEVDPTSRLYDTFGAYDIAGAERLGIDEKRARNEIYHSWVPRLT